jgi:hypothetical protein
MKGVKSCSSTEGRTNLSRSCWVVATPEYSKGKEHAASLVSPLRHRRAPFVTNGSCSGFCKAYDEPDEYSRERTPVNATHHASLSGLLRASSQEQSPRAHDFRPRRRLPFRSHLSLFIAASPPSQASHPLLSPPHPRSDTDDPSSTTSTPLSPALLKLT